jgi:hypothetical protein
MNKLVFKEPDYESSPYDDVAVEQLTTTPSLGKFDVSHQNPILKKFFRGTFIISPYQRGSSMHSKILANTIQNFDKFLTDYALSIDSNIYGYIEQIKSITNYSRYTKNEIIKKILSFKTLNSNWDGYGALPLEIESATNAIILIDLVGESIFSAVKDFYPNPYGTISFEWENNSNEIFSLEVGNESMSYFIKLASQEPIYFDDRPVNNEEAKKISKCIRLL